MAQLHPRRALKFSALCEVRARPFSVPVLYRSGLPLTRHRPRAGGFDNLPEPEKRAKLAALRARATAMMVAAEKYELDPEASATTASPQARLHCQSANLRLPVDGDDAPAARSRVAPCSTPLAPQAGSALSPVLILKLPGGAPAVETESELLLYALFVATAVPEWRVWSSSIIEKERRGCELAEKEGKLYIVGRIKDVLTMRGRSLHASDIETCDARSLLHDAPPRDSTRSQQRTPICDPPSANPRMRAAIHDARSLKPRFGSSRPTGDALSMSGPPDGLLARRGWLATAAVWVRPAFALNVSGGTGEELLALVAELRPEMPVADAQLRELCRGIADAVREPAPARLCACPPLPAFAPAREMPAPGAPVGGTELR